MKIGVLGAGTWGFSLASLLASKGFSVHCWTRKAEFADQLNASGEHPKLPKQGLSGKLVFTTDLGDVLDHAEFLVEAITSSGMRPVFEQVKALGCPDCPIVITSKGIEQETGLILPEVAIEVLGEDKRHLIGALSGPGYAQEVIQGLPTSVVGTAFEQDVMFNICNTFASETFRVYPNADIRGVAFGGALKNCIAIACGVSDGLGFGTSAKAALMTRGLHEIRKLGVALGCRAETFYGLAGMGDVFLTCSSLMSRNFRFGHLIAQGRSIEQAREEIGMVVEGAYTCFSALQLGEQTGIPLPITNNVVDIITGELKPENSAAVLMKRSIKEEHL